MHTLAGLAPEGCLQVACGAAHPLVLTRDGAVLGFGLNATGQLGTGGASPLPCPSPVVVQLPPSRAMVITQLACGEEFSCALTSDGKLLTGGRA